MGKISLENTQLYTGVLVLICLILRSSGFVVDDITNDEYTATLFPDIAQTSNEMAPILAVSDFLIEGDADYDVEDDVGGDSFNDKEVDDDNDFDGRIVGGSTVSISQFPHQVSVQLNRAHICGGTIVGPNLVLTAAHCVEYPHKTNLYNIRVGSSQHKRGGQLVGVRHIIRHELYSKTTLDNDVAIIVLTGRLSFNQNVKAVRIAKKSDAVPAKRRLFISGWGLTSETGDVMPILRYVSVKLLSETACQKSYKALTRITSRMFCAGSPKGGRDSCQGDSGGPLISYVNGRPRLFGIVSWGVGCAQKDFPGVYAKVSALRPWINSQIKNLRNRKMLEN